MHDPEHHDEHKHSHGPEHGHRHGPFQKDHDTGPAGPYEVLGRPSLLIEKGVLTAQEIAAQVDLMDSDPGARRQGGSGLGRAWVEPGFKRRLLKDTRAALREFGIDVGTLAEFCTVRTPPKTLPRRRRWPRRLPPRCPTGVGRL
jgi:nitrile hydratase